VTDLGILVWIRGDRFAEGDRLFTGESMYTKEQGICWVSTGSLKLEEMNPETRHVNAHGLGWQQLPIEMAIARLAQKAYYGYGTATGFTNYQGIPMPEWTALPSSIQQAWESCVRTILFETGYCEGLSSPGLVLENYNTDKPFLIA
jgi:hypothetical protein